jgi:hypothetical protein
MFPFRPCSSAAQDITDPRSGVLFADQPEYLQAARREPNYLLLLFDTQTLYGVLRFIGRVVFPKKQGCFRKDWGVTTQCRSAIDCAPEVVRSYSGSFPTRSVCELQALHELIIRAEWFALEWAIAAWVFPVNCGKDRLL